ncbi:hypothetical protein CXP52_03385 [Bacillus paralicheniformis]|nr:hypothetical protein CXP52_03385 [Bacillus paralicheniformis]
MSRTEHNRKRNSGDKPKHTMQKFCLFVHYSSEIVNAIKKYRCECMTMKEIMNRNQSLLRKQRS